MHLIQFREIMRDAEVAYAIHPIVRKYLLTVKDTTKALIACGVPRASNVAQSPPADFSTLICPLFRMSKRSAKSIFRYAQTKKQA